MMNTAFALVESGVAQNVILCLQGVSPADLGISGVWIPVDEGTVGVGFIFNAETGSFAAPVQSNDVVIEQEPIKEEPTE